MIKSSMGVVTIEGGENVVMAELLTLLATFRNGKEKYLYDLCQLELDGKKEEFINAYINSFEFMDGAEPRKLAEQHYDLAQKMIKEAQEQKERDFDA